MSGFSDRPGHNFANMTDVSRADTEGGYGWAVVAGAFTANAVGFGILYSFTIFFNPILEEFGVGRGGVSVVPSVAASLMLASGALVGRLSDRVGPRKVIAVGSLLMFGGLFLAAASPSIWHVYLSYGLLLGLGVGCCFLPSNAAVGQWFTKRRGLATGIAVSGSGVGSVVMAPIASRLIESGDWRSALRVIAVGGLILLLGSSMLVRERVHRQSTSVFADMRSNRTFQILYVAAFVASYGYWVPFVHIVPFARDHGVGVASAALLVAVMGIANIVGRVVLGSIADRMGRRRILQVAVGAMTVSVFLWPLAIDTNRLLLFSLSYGFFAGTFISLLFALTADYFGVARLGGITGLLNTAAALGTLVGAPLSGLLFDGTGSYTLPIVIAGLSMFAGSVVLLTLPDERRGASLAQA